jgi:hypothetical protein
MLRFEEHIDLRKDIHPGILSLSDWDESIYQETIYDVPITKGQYDKMVRECEGEILFEKLEGMFGFTPETFDVRELVQTPFFKELPVEFGHYYLSIIYDIMDKYNTIEETVDMFYSYTDDNSFDIDYDIYPIPEDDQFEFECESSDSNDEEDE